MARWIPLTQGKYAIVDDEDYEWLNQWKWCVQKDYSLKKERYYAVRGARSGEKILMHRFILGVPQDKQTDHRNHNGLDNRRENIRMCCGSENQFNAMKDTTSHSSTSKYKGVSWNIQRQKWQAQICKNRQAIHLGQFDDEINAAKAYDRKAKELFGDFAYLNLGD